MKSTMERCFFIDTPIGQLKVYAKHEVDCAADFPGIYIDLICPGLDYGNNMLCCVEYDSCHKQIQTVVYQPRKEDPVTIVAHEIEEGQPL